MNDRVCLYAPFPASTNYTDMARVQIVGARHAVPGFQGHAISQVFGWYCSLYFANISSKLSSTKLSDPGDVAHAFSVLCRAFEPDISESIVNLSPVQVHR